MDQVLNKITEIVESLNYENHSNQYSFQDSEDELVLHYVVSISHIVTTRVIIAPNNSLVLSTLQDELDSINDEDDIMPIEIVESVLEKYGKVYGAEFWT